MLIIHTCINRCSHRMSISMCCNPHPLCSSDWLAIFPAMVSNACWHAKVSLFPVNLLRRLERISRFLKRPSRDSSVPSSAAPFPPFCQTPSSLIRIAAETCFYLQFESCFGGAKDCPRQRCPWVRNCIVFGLSYVDEKWNNSGSS
jgi:hypothetical protein